MCPAKFILRAEQQLSLGEDLLMVGLLLARQAVEGGVRVSKKHLYR